MSRSETEALHEPGKYGALSNTRNPLRLQCLLQCLIGYPGVALLYGSFSVLGHRGRNQLLYFSSWTRSS